MAWHGMASLLGILKFVAIVAASETVAAVIVVVGGDCGDGVDAAAAAESETGDGRGRRRVMQRSFWNNR